jgi:hypothetical protein
MKLHKQIDFRDISWKLFRIRKELHSLSTTRKGHRAKILFIVGCQRSGTTLLAMRVFYRDFNAKVYNEYSELTSNDINRIRLNSLESVKMAIDKVKAPIVVVKALVESQNTPELLNYFEGSKALWICRFYKDVALSNVAKFGIRRGIKDLRPIVENETNNWRAEKVSESTRETVSKYFSETMSPNDAAALFWFARNSLFFELGLDQNPNVMVCIYDYFARDPGNMLRNIYKYIDASYPGDRIISDVHAKSVGKGDHVYLTPQIDRLCNRLYEKLVAVYHSQESLT